MHSKSISPDDSPYQSEAPPTDLYPLSGIAATRNGNVPYLRIVRVLAQISRPLAELHRAGRIHGNISIDSVGLDGVGHAYLMTAATDSPRSAGDSALRDGRASGYNAFEQYTDDPQWQVGPWTDVYALCAVAFRLITGAPPPSAIDRCVRDTLGSLAERAIKGYSPAFLEAIDRGLALRPQDRFENVHAMLVALGWREDAPVEPASITAAPTGSDREHSTAPATSLGTSPTTSRPAPALQQAVGIAAPVSHFFPTASTAQASHNAASLTEATGAGVTSDRRGKRWIWVSWPVGLALAAVLSYLWLGTEIAVPQINPRAPIGSDARSPEARSPSDTGPPTAAPSVSASATRPATPPDIFSQNVSDPAAGTQVQADGREAPLPAPAASNTADDSPGEKAVKPVLAVRVAVDIRPWGEVFVDGASRGVSPPLRQLSLLPGTYQVTVRNPNAPSYSKRVTVNPGQRSVAITHQFTAP